MTLCLAIIPFHLLMGNLEGGGATLYRKEVRRMDEKDLGKKLDELRKVLEVINRNLRRLWTKSMREWISSYHDAIGKIPDYFTLEEWEETEKLLYADMVQEIKGDFTETCTLRSTMAIKTLELFKQERAKLLEARKRKG